MDTFTQESRILAALNKGERISPLDALDRFDCLRLGARIYDLRRKGHKIKMQLMPNWGTVTKHYALYWIDKKDRRK